MRIINFHFLQNRMLSIIILCFTISQVVAQNSVASGNIKGQVADQVTLETLPFCNVILEGTTIGVTTDENGIFLLENVNEGNYNIRFSYLGYNEKNLQDVRVTRNKTAYYKVALTENSLALDQVEIKAYKYENISSMPVSTFSMSREEIFRSPASNGNIFRAISTLPGVQSGGGSFAALAVRGQGTEENATFVDQFPVFELSHLAGGRGGFDDPNGGRFSIFGPRAVDGLVLQTGGFSALQGRRSSSYMEVNIKEGNPENAVIDGLISLTGMAVSYSGPLGNKSQLYTSLRYQNFVPALTLTGQADLGFPSFADLTLKFNSRLNKKNKLTILALLNPEKFIRNTENVVKDDNIINQYENNFLADVNNGKGLLGIKLNTQINNKSHWTNLGYFRFKSTDTSYGIAYPEERADGNTLTYDEISFNDRKGKIENTEREMGVRSIFTSQINERATLKAGIDITNVHIDHSRILFQTDTIYSFYRNSLPQNQFGQNYFVLTSDNFDSAYNGRQTNVSGYFNLWYNVNSKLSSNVGLRYDYTGFSKTIRISPRFNMKYSISEKTNVSFATGIYYQDPLHIFISDNNGDSLEPEKSIHFISGLTHYFNLDLKLTLEGYYKSFSNLIVRPNPAINSLDNIGEGEASGIDISLVKRLSNRFNGQISYSYSQSTRDNHDGIGLYDHLYSQPHIFNFLIGYQPSSNWVLSWKLRYSTGQPTNSSIIYEDIFSDEDFIRFGQELTGRHDIRNDNFIGIDLRIDRRIQFENFSINAFLDIQNVMNRENASTRSFFEITGEYKPQALGILPTIGWRFEF